MTTLAQMQQELAALTIRVDDERARVRTDALDEIQRIMADNGLTTGDLADLIPKVKKRRLITNGASPATSKSTRPAMYQEPKSGVTWSGMGREPFWIKGKKREKFLIAG
jgi:DNA-binding protein H-NS